MTTRTTVQKDTQLSNSGQLSGKESTLRLPPAEWKINAIRVSIREKIAQFEKKNVKIDDGTVNSLDANASKGEGTDTATEASAAASGVGGGGGG